MLVCLPDGQTEDGQLRHDVVFARKSTETHEKSALEKSKAICYNRRMEI